MEDKAMAKVKAANYSEAEVARLKAGYSGADNATEVAALAKELGKSAASVRAKLASLGVYAKAEKVTAKAVSENKTALADAIGEKVGLLEHEAEGLAKAPKAALAKVLAALTNS